jgi:hypothetical protein
VSAAGTAGTYLIQVAIPNANPAAAKAEARPSAPRRRRGRHQEQDAGGRERRERDLGDGGDAAGQPG